MIWRIGYTIIRIVCLIIMEHVFNVNVELHLHWHINVRHCITTYIYVMRLNLFIAICYLYFDINIRVRIIHLSPHIPILSLWLLNRMKHFTIWMSSLILPKKCRTYIFLEQLMQWRPQKFWKGGGQSQKRSSIKTKKDPTWKKIAKGPSPQLSIFYLQEGGERLLLPHLLRAPTTECD